ncbi:MAG: helix-turn-helix transcriptional regulator [Lachnospiraceae bacterium]|nr:helix-turn-helix transcriptional regulator [Lachnospiraceae bacterium]
MKIGEQIKRLRKERNMTQEQLAEKIGISFQAVSKWENDISLPDVATLPIIAGFFGVSMDTIFDYDAEKNAEKALEIAKQTWTLRESNPELGKSIIFEGLKQYPENDILLENLLYLTESPDEIIDIALRTISATKDNSIKYDALRFLASAYKQKGSMDEAKAALEQIPELYFTRLSEMAYILTGEEKRIAAEKQRGNSIEILVEMQARIAEDMVDKGELANAKNEYKRALDLLDLFNASAAWDSYRTFLKKKIQEIG